MADQGVLGPVPKVEVRFEETVQSGGCDASDAIYQVQRQPRRLDQEPTTAQNRCKVWRKPLLHRVAPSPMLQDTMCWGPEGDGIGYVD
ncbi:hypothetical protein N7492_000622 [Penicillium capsulatum]|uniref:Uncharacterized protein n=1 Tax=Penicillium capsulatum TaxID=69766 RepID=A0A9W9IT55_9EURO|nr:hypothetical protein N7492_000622 [Penicillium capsulatum]KAJ6130320.1 hypothetical protein N7512_003100 [Penicillium capsulatum]